MAERHKDGSAGDVDYGRVGASYASYRQPEPKIMAQILSALGDAKSILNVGAGAGSYEPVDREVVPVEPSATMRLQRPAHLSPAVDAFAENLPFEDDCFEAAMTTFSIHQWSDLAAGLREIRRVTRGPIVILTCDPSLVQEFWLNEYAPLVLETESRRYPSFSAIESVLGARIEIRAVAIPLHCLDGFNEAYYGRPERLLDPGARQACSAWSFLEEALAIEYVERLRNELDLGEWDACYGALRTQANYEGSLRLIIAKSQ